VWCMLVMYGTSEACWIAIDRRNCSITEIDAKGRGEIGLLLQELEVQVTKFVPDALVVW
jgi:hypothetical protein